MTVIKIKNSAVGGRVPSTGDIEVAELAINLADKKLYSKDASGSIFEIGAAGDLPSGENPPSGGNNVGDLFYNTKPGEEGLYYWDGSAWILLTSEPADGEGFVKISGDHMTGDLTLGTVDANGNILLTNHTLNSAGDATLGAASSATVSLGYAAGTTAQLVQAGTSSAAGSPPVLTVQSAGVGGGGATDYVQSTSPLRVGENALQPTITLDTDGSAEFAGDVKIGKATALGNLDNVWIDSTAEGGSVKVTGAVTGSSFVSYYVNGATGNHFSGSYDNVANFQVDSLGNTQIGGTIPTAPNISLNADGSASFAGTISSTATGSGLSMTASAGQSGFVVEGIGNTGSDLGLFYFQNENAAGASRLDSSHNLFIEGLGNFSGGINTDGRIRIGGTIPSAPNITLNADGSAGFAGAVTIGGGDPGSAVLDQAIRFDSNGSSQYRKDAAGEVITVYQGGTLPQHKKASISSDGSASFAGVITQNADPNDVDTAGNVLYSTGGITCVADSGPIWRGYTTGNGDYTSAIGVDGSAEFKGTVKVAGGAVQPLIIGDADGTDIDVRERLQAARETFQELQVAVANATDFAGLKAAMLVALEDYVA